MACLTGTPASEFLPPMEETPEQLAAEQQKTMAALAAFAAQNG
jgi:hypothetical protein